MPTPRKYSSNAARQAAYRARYTLRRQGETALAVPSAMTTAVQNQQQLPPIPASTGSTRWNATLKVAHSLLERIGYEMETYYEERSEKWHESERGENFTERMGAVEEIVGLLEDLM